MIDSIGKWLVIGLVVATLITVFVPDSFFVGFRQYPLLAMIIVVLIAVPMYICATGSIPIAMSLMLKGLTPGAAFVMLMAGPAANFASIVILNRTQGKKATIIYVASVVATAIAFGLIIDYLLPEKWFTVRGMAAGHCHHATLNTFETICSIALTILLIASFIRTRFIKGHSHKNINNSNQTTMTKEYKIQGMNCAHCRASVEKAISDVEGVEKVEVSLSDGIAYVTGDVAPDTISEAVHKAGFNVVK